MTMQSEQPSSTSPFVACTSVSLSSTATLDVSSERDPPPMPDPPLWTHRLSASFASMADQISAASHALSLIPPGIASLSVQPAEDLTALNARVESIERTQDRILAELEGLRNDVRNLQNAPNTESGSEALEKKLADLKDKVELDQKQLYARLHNAQANISKMLIKALPTANGKPPPNFPGTKGEFEHVTKERYEAILKAYGQPIKGDITAKREALRLYIGLPA